jgi:hypothetical protein
MLMTDIADVTDVLLSDGWHEVSPSSFRVGMYEIYSSLDKPDEGLDDHFQLPMAAFSFQLRDTELLIEGPLPSIQAIKRRNRRIG